MITVHIVSSLYPPAPGGLQLWTADLAAALQAAALRPIVYVCELPAAAAANRDAPFEIVDIGPRAAEWLRPLGESGVAAPDLARDRARVTFACLRGEIAARRGAGAHLILSNFVVTAGFIAHLVAEDFGLPHVAVVAGTDFTRGLRNSQERPVFREVCAAARLVVAKSAEQRVGIARAVPAARVAVVETSVAVPERRWRRASGGVLRIFSDGGFSFKKGTGVLIEAFRALNHGGITARLEICGDDQPRESSYWTAQRAALVADGLAVSFPGHVDGATILDRLHAADIYASASLGEGSSAGRARALCVGMPLVTTQCGELAADPGVAHVRLVPVGDATGFAAALRALAVDLQRGGLVPDAVATARLRARFDPAEEWARWVGICTQEADHG